MSRIYNHRGLTLIELMISIVLISLTIGAIWMLFKTGFSTFYTQEVRTGIKGETGRGFITMGRELRQATSMATATATSLSFTANTDTNGLDETIQYSWAGSGSPLQRISGSVTQTLTNSVSSLAFSYYDSNNNLLSFPATVSQVRLVAYNLTTTSQDEAFNLRSQVRLRNL